MQETEFPAESVRRRGGAFSRRWAVDLQPGCSWICGDLARRSQTVVGRSVFSHGRSLRGQYSISFPLAKMAWES